jgi:hypothetical protein
VLLYVREIRIPRCVLSDDDSHLKSRRKESIYFYKVHHHFKLFFLCTKYMSDLNSLPRDSMNTNHMTLDKSANFRGRTKATSHVMVDHLSFFALENSH